MQPLQLPKADAAVTAAGETEIAAAEVVATVTVVAGVAEIATVVETAVDAVVETEIEDLDRTTGIVATDLHASPRPSERLLQPLQNP